MKHTLGVLTTMFLLLAATNGKCQEKLDRKRVALVIILDTSGSCSEEDGDFRTLGQQTGEVLEPGDYLEIIASYGNSPRLVLAMEIKGNEAEEANKIRAALNSIQTYFLGDGTISTALTMAQKRLTAVCDKGKYDRAAVVVFTDGEIDNRDAAGIISRAKQMKADNWPLYMTGTPTTNKNLLIAATDDLFVWRSLDEANPGLFLRQFRQPTESHTEQSIEDERELDPIVGPLLPDILRSPSSLHESGRSSTGTHYRVQTQIHSEFSMGPALGPQTEELAPKEQDAAATPPPVEPNERAEEPVKEELPAAKDGLNSPSPTWNQFRKLAANPRSWIITAIAILASTLLLAALIAIRRASRVSGGFKSRPGASTQERAGTLVVTINGQSYPLGPYQRFSSIHLGRGVGNTIKRNDEGIEDRHLRLFKKGANLMIHNLAKTPFVAGGKTVRPGHKESLTLPSTIQITEKIRMTVAVVKPKTEPANGGENHGHQ